MFCDEKTGQMSFLTPEPKFDKTSRLWKDFLIFHETHPEVYEKYKEEIINALMSGRELYSVQVIMENNRWDGRRKINNNHATYYARLFIEENPQYKGFFRLRSIKKD